MEGTINAITLDLTEDCNLRCKYPCFHGENALIKWDKKPRVLKLETGLKAIDWIFSDEISGKKLKRPLNISFWGGEPLMNWEVLKQLVLRAEELGKKTGKEYGFGGTTNVTLFDKEKVDWCKEHDVKFLLSIDGPKEIHDIYRTTKNGKGSFRMVDRNIDYILKNWEFMSARMSPAPKNIHMFAHSMRWLYDRGFWNLCYSPAYEGEWTDKHMETAMEQMIELVEWMVELRKNGKKVRLKHMDDGMMDLVRGKVSQKVPCGAGNHYVGIAVDGTIWACHRMHKEIEGVMWPDNPYCLGHLDHDGITNDEWRSNFINYNKLLLENNDRCVRCELFGKFPCSGGCYATNLDFTGSIFQQSEVMCSWNYIQFKASKLLLQRSKEEGLEIKSSSTSGKRKGECVCYNMCYQEDTKDEIIVLNRQDGNSCLCFNANYNGSKFPKEKIEHMRKTANDLMGKKNG